MSELFKPETQLEATTPLISEKERQRRQEAAEFARCSLALEGFFISPEAQLMQDKFINGEVTIEECIQALHDSIVKRNSHTE